MEKKSDLVFEPWGAMIQDFCYFGWEQDRGILISYFLLLYNRKGEKESTGNERTEQTITYGFHPGK